MNITKLNELVSNSKLNKAQLAERCGISRTTLDNVLSGADAKVSTIESLAKALCVSAGVLFDDNYLDYNSVKSKDEIETYKNEIARLQSLLNKQKKSTKVIVELDVDDDEFIKMGLKEKVIQILNK